MYRFWVVKRGPVCLMGQHCVAFKKENSPIHLRGLAAPVIWKVRVLWYEFTDVTLAWEDGQWVEAHKIILAGCSPNKSTPALMFELNASYSDVQKTKTKTANRSRFWLPKNRTLEETIEEGCRPSSPSVLPSPSTPWINFCQIYLCKSLSNSDPWVQYCFGQC